MVTIKIVDEKCDGAECGECVEVCSMDILMIDGEKIAIKNPNECSLCEVCTDVCPNEAIILTE
ncbi:4Fe-4S binding protein [Methanobacterium petrolearium]|uniref:4Fe-4S binding protein n=1 Tax=Methanobacterium petrolearium TaxID=710190 RepID=UPI001AE4CD36|nr:4Fe-4S dicluster domain-containing protein [Methanobacterium petrolearium]MBP1944981.1 NAD-dependent dihydropyrimidine dehydrogenase PreA subunit [Methanobacterium petrolearium]BDZ70305.1 ferredoxin [Methanobacterium petrolearium]